MDSSKKLPDYIAAYHNTGTENDHFYNEFTANTDAIPFLKNHRDYIEQSRLGFGDRAFHYMWYILFNEMQRRKSPVCALEIGVYKGQVISLWSLLSTELNIPAEISAITPLEGTLPAGSFVNNRIVKKIRRLLSASYRKQEKEGNLYPKEDYYTIISNLFQHFGLNFNTVQLYRGYSNTPEVLGKIRDKKFDIIYIDGDHSYEGAKNDIKNYTPLIVSGGYLVMDDASWFLEGTVFWKGHKEVSRACDIIEAYGFENVLNIGHNRVYKKQ